MSASVSTKCPHCRVDIKVDRPDEPRSAPCPSCNGTILIPEHIYPRGWRPRRSTGLNEQVQFQPAGTTLPLSKSFLITCGMLLVASSTLFGGLMGAYGRSPQVRLESQEKPESVPLASPDPAFKSGIEKLEAQRKDLRSEITRVQNEIEKVDESIRKLLNTSEVNVEILISAMKGTSR